MSNSSNQLSDSFWLCQPKMCCNMSPSNFRRIINRGFKVCEDYYGNPLDGNEEGVATDAKDS